MPSEAQTVPAGDRAAMSGEPVKLGERHEIMPTSPLAALNTPGGNAFAARSLRDKRVETFALVCSGTVLPRTDVVSTFANVDNPTAMRLFDWGVVDWPTDRVRRYCLVFERPLGKRLMSAITDTIEPMPEETLTRQVVQPVVALLRELSSRGLVHGGIRPTNLYYRDLTAGALMVGEAVSTPPGYGQPLIMETVERGMTSPSARGTGTVADDLYSLGVTLLILLLGRNPVASLDDDTLLQAKIERGSFPALVGQMRLPLGIGEVIRGLMVDDPKQRWSLNDLDLWLSGRRLSPKQPQIPRRAARPIEFQGAEYWHCRTLARALSRHPAAATQVIESGELDKWLRRSMADDVRGDAVANAIQTAGSGKGGPMAERLVSRVCMALDPHAPIRYRGKSYMLDGIAATMAECFLRGESPQSVAEVISNQLPMFWVNVQTDFRPEFVPLVHNFDQWRTFLDRTAPGLGIERALYEMNPTMPCVSPLVLGWYPLTPADVLRALEWAASGGERGKEPVDRHIAAFLAARHKRTEELLYAQLSPNIDPLRRTIAMLTILAEVQTRTATPSLPHLCAWMVTLLDPAFRRFHSRPHQEEVRKQAESAAHGGRLAELLKIVDDPESLRRDRAEFEAAQISYREAEGEIEKLRDLIADRDGITEGTGRQVAAVVSSLVSTVLVAGIILFYAL
ncbi:serine/threonine protein kinase [Azospirillum halopraeferens]|uniref:serine/threonine protein kinase n=1 Tax=Azospirillum halopraeferens TaxID=34010 RepID=UPI00048B4F1F|nr:serine/threonine protein kinase [Azospirillum halopraeferens]